MGGGGSDITPTTISASTLEYPEQGTDAVANNLASLGNSIVPYSTWSTSELFNNYYAPFLKGNYNLQSYPGFSSAYDTLRGTMEGQYNQAKENILASNARGGALTDALANLEYQRARNTGLGTSQLTSSILDKLWSGANSLATGEAAKTGLSALSSAGNLDNQIAQLKLQTQLGNQNAYLNAEKSNQSANLQAQQANEASDAQSKSSGLNSLTKGLGSLVGLSSASGLTGGLTGSLSSLFSPSYSISGMSDAGAGTYNTYNANGLGGFTQGKS